MRHLALIVPAVLVLNAGGHAHITVVDSER